MNNRLGALLICLAFFVLASCSSKIPNQGSGKSEWMALFNGKNLNDWYVKIHHHNTGENYGNTFRVEDGIIKIRYDQYEQFNEQYGHLYYKTPFSKYHLKLEYRFTGEWRKDAPSYTILNSGVMFHSQDPHTMPKEQDWPISVEMQFLAGLPDGKPRPTGNMCSPGTDIFYQGKLYDGHCLSSSSKTYPPGRWVKAELIVLGDSLITHIIEGDTVLQYSKPMVGGGVANRFDPKQKIDGTALKSGFIALQSEGQPIDFRNIYLKDLSK
ncbi:MAG TPA: DUF1080 domain-containing protein [Niabella sp.]|nr:DUF1080 domain-containing protein [Niabella sp.]HOZ96626.1 DUF1080 domain-containing protein [Niabella sp.]HQW14506.1 DUF1080 domain-containing protein [Niabella sp.]HQX19921.1 DUF1080 domain-containing protein [Niabella sp.]HQX41528.1 DUF1080 domain-containing protein [Niabella sp.]